jgi:hypothetical protein
MRTGVTCGENVGAELCCVFLIKSSRLFDDLADRLCTLGIKVLILVVAVLPFKPIHDQVIDGGPSSNHNVVIACNYSNWLISTSVVQMPATHRCVFLCGRPMYCMPDQVMGMW